MITIFTPTYNRAFTIGGLYDSLCRQTSSDFEWLIVDDGSMDDTETVVNAFISEGKINIRYVKQENGGKHRAINKGISLANGELFFIVDSDDFITDNAIEKVEEVYCSIKNDSTFAAVSGLRMHLDGSCIGGDHNFGILDCNNIKLRLKYHINGDMAEVWRTDVLREYPFPEIKGEKFVPETLIWNRIGKTYKTRYFSKAIYVCEYLTGGLSANFTKGRVDSPLYSMTLYSELYHMNIPLMAKVKAAINYWRFTPLKYVNKSIYFKMCRPLSVCCLSIGYVFRLKDKFTI